MREKKYLVIFICRVDEHESISSYHIIRHNDFRFLESIIPKLEPDECGEVSWLHNEYCIFNYRDQYENILTDGEMTFLSNFIPPKDKGVLSIKAIKVYQDIGDEISLIKKRGDW